MPADELIDRVSSHLTGDARDELIFVWHYGNNKLPIEDTNWSASVLSSDESGQWSVLGSLDGPHIARPCVTLLVGRMSGSRALSSSARPAGTWKSGPAPRLTRYAPSGAADARPAPLLDDGNKATIARFAVLWH